MCFIDDERGAKGSGRWVGQDVDVWEWSLKPPEYGDLSSRVVLLQAIHNGGDSGTARDHTINELSNFIIL